MSVTSACVRDPEVERADRAPVPYEYPSSYATGLGATVNGLYRHACRVGYRGEYCTTPQHAPPNQAAHVQMM